MFAEVLTVAWFSSAGVVVARDVCGVGLEARSLPMARDMEMSSDPSQGELKTPSRDSLGPLSL